MSTLNLPAALVGVAAFAPMPSPSSLTVTATGGGSSANGILLSVEVLDNAGLVSPANTGSGTSGNVKLTPEATGSLAYSAVTVGIALAPSPAAGNTAIAAITDGCGTFVSTATLTAGVPFQAGASNSGATVAAIEVQPLGGTIATDASSPASASNPGGTTTATAAFAPPTGGRLILALVSMQGGSGVAAMGVTDSFGLTWTQAVVSNSAGKGYAGIWYAYTPANLAFANIAPPPGVVGTAYSRALTASGGYGSYRWSVASGSLPAGLSLNASTGVISGTPTTAALSTFTVTVTDGFGNTATSGTIALIVNQGITGSGSIRQGWTDAAGQYFYGTKKVAVATTDHDWIFVSVSWEAGEDAGIAYCSDDVHNDYRPAAISPPGSAVMTQVFAVPNAKPASTVYVSVSAFVRWLTICVLDVTGLQAGLVVDASNVYSGGPATTFTESLTTAHPDFILAMGAFQGTPQTITQAGLGATWNALSWAGINGNAADGITQSGAWAATSGAASPSMQFTGTSGNYAGCMVAVYTQGGLPANANPAWPVVKWEAAFGYTPQEPVAPPVWTDITSRFKGLNGQHGRNFELDEIAAADITVDLDNFDGALSPGVPGPYYPNVTLITPIRGTFTWQGRVYTLFRGLITAIPQAYDFQRGEVKAAASDDFSKLAVTLLPPAMIQEMLYDKPLDLWPLNEQQGATRANNWSGRSAAGLMPTAGPYGPGAASGSAAGGGAAGFDFQAVLSLFGISFPVSTVPVVKGNNPATWTGLPLSPSSIQASPPPTPTTPTTGFGNTNSGSYPSGLAGSTDSVWGNTTGVVASNFYQGTVLVDSNDITLPLTVTGATYSVWQQMYYMPSNTNGTIMALTDQAGSAGSKVYLILSYDGTHVTVTQTSGSTSFTPPAYLFDSKFHLWTVTISTAGTITVYLDGAVLGTRAGSFPAGAPTMLQWGGDVTATTAAAGGIFTGCQYLAGVYDRVVDSERIVSWFQSGATGFLDELGGIRIQRVLAWARWSAPQAVDAGVSLQQPLNYLTGGYGTNGVTGAFGNWNTSGGSTGIDSGAQADVTLQDIANTENGFLFMTAAGGITFRQRGGSAPAALPLGDADYALNTWEFFESGLGPWTSVSSCTVAQSAGWSYAGKHSALVTVTGTPVTAYAWGDRAAVTPAQQTGFSCWVMSLQGCTVRPDIDFYNASNVFISTVSGANVSVPPMTPAFLNLPASAATAAPAGAAWAYPHPTLVSSPATGTQLYFDRPRLSPTGFQCPYGDDVEIVEDIQFLYNDIAITRNVDQASYRARDTTSRNRYYPRIYTRTIFSSVDDPNAVTNCANTLLSAFAYPALRVSRVVVNAAENPEAWPFVLSTEIGDTVSFTRTPVGGAAVTGSFTVLSIEPEIAPDRAQFTYVLAPTGVF